MAKIAEAVVIRVRNDGWIKPHPIQSHKVGKARRMDAQSKDHWRRLRAVIGNLVAGPDLHENLFDPDSCGMSAKN